MFKFVVLLSAIACVLGAAIPDEGLLPQLDGRIIGGEETIINLFPWQVSVQRFGMHSCGGSVYSNKIIVTAAHCLQSISASFLRVRAGSSYWNFGGFLVGVAAFRNHEGYNSNTMENDIAVIRLSSALSVSSVIKTIGLATSAPDNGATAAVSGWGSQSFELIPVISSQLRFIDTKIVDRAECSSDAYGYGDRIKEMMICTADSGKDTCQSDDGGPLVSDGILVGIVSWGNECDQPNYPRVYSDVAALRPWVVSTAGSV